MLERDPQCADPTPRPMSPNRHPECQDTEDVNTY